MEESQREAMYNAWNNSNINLIPTVEKNEDSVKVSVIFENETYTESFSKKDDILNLGFDSYYNFTYNRLLSKMKSINKKIEIKY
jgi:hypothetical protein